MTERLLRLRSVQQLVEFGKSKLYELVSEGRFPAPRKIEGCSFWRESEVLAWIAARTADKTDAA